MGIKTDSIPLLSGAVVSVFTGGGFIGAGVAGPTGDRLGRKKTILIGASIFVLGGALQAAAQSLAFLYAGRALAGIGYVNPFNSNLPTTTS